MRLPIFPMGPWNAEDGDPRDPGELAGVAVHEVICTRDDPPAALLMLADGRYAITGDRLAVGSARQLKLYVRRQLRRRGSEAERAWFEAIAYELARRSPRPFRLVGRRLNGRPGA
jgi:potassium/hydrogen antiporter